MKSDREFLDGIYKKAQEYENNQQKDLLNKDKSIYHRGYRTLRPVLVTGMAIALICSGIFAYESGVFPFKTKTSDISSQDYNHTPGLASNDMTRGVDPISYSDTSLSLDIQDAMREGTVIRGRVTELIESELQVEIKVEISRVYAGIENIGSTISVKLGNNKLSSSAYGLLTGSDDILFYLKMDENNQYSIAHETYGIFYYYEQVDGDDIFTNEDGVRLNTNIFKTNEE